MPNENGSNQGSGNQGPAQSRIEDRIYADSFGKENGIYGAELKAGLEKLATAELHDSAKTNELRSQAARFFGDLGFAPNEVERIHSTMVHHQLNPADDQTCAKWGDETKKRLRDTYGDEASVRLKVAQEYLASRGYDKALNHSGAGSHPDVVMAIVEKAWRRKQEGKK